MNKNRTPKPNKAQSILRRIAPRALRTLERHADGSPPLSSFGHTLTPAAMAFAAAYDAANNAVTASGEDALGGLRAIESLQALVRGWLGPLSRDLPGLDAGSFVERLRVPDDVIATAQRLLDLVRERQGNTTPTLPYAGELVASLTTAIEQAAKEWSEYQATMVQQAALGVEARRSAAVLEKELAAFRRALRQAIGTSHRDYQQLRYPRIAQEIANEDTSLVTEDVPISIGVNSQSAGANGARIGVHA